MCRSAHDSSFRLLRVSPIRNNRIFVFFRQILLCLWLYCGSFPYVSAQKQYDTDSLLQRVYNYTATHQLEQTGFTSDIYVQHYLRTKRRGVIMRYMPGALHLERGNREYFGESFSSYQYLPPAQVYKKDIATFSTMPYVKKPRDRWIGRYSMSIYEPNLFTDYILSPFNACNRKFYKYIYQYSYQSMGRLIAHIDVVPRIWNTQLVHGNADIDVQSGRVSLFSFQFFYGWARLHVTGEMGETGNASLLPKKISLVSRMKLLGNKLEERFDATVNYDFNKTLKLDADDSLKYRDRYDMTAMCQLRVDTTHMQRSLSFFEKNRPVKLMPFQQAIYREAAQRKQTDKDSLKTDYKEQRRELAEDFFLDSHTLHLGGNGKVKLPPILTPAMVEWSKREGFSLRTRLAFHFDISPKQQLQYTPRIGYNFKQKQVYWKCPLLYRFLPQYDGYLKIEAAGGDHIYNSKQADDVRKQFAGIAHYDSLLTIFNSYNFHYYRDNRLLAEFCFQPVVGLKCFSGLRFHQRKMIQWNKIAENTSMLHTLKSFAPCFRIEWTPGLYYYRENYRPVPLRSAWPTFMVDYERSLRAIDPHTKYERIEFDAAYQLKLHALRALYFRAGGGFYTQRGENCFLDYENFRNNYMPAISENDFIGQFQLLDNHWYNESDYYFRMSGSYESPMMLFSRIKYLTRIVEREYLFCNLLTVSSLKFYSEFGYGISMPLLNLAAFASFAGKKQTAFGCKIAIHLGDSQ